MTSELLAGIVASIISVGANFIPQYESQPPAVKQGVMIFLMLVVTVASFGLSCANVGSLDFFECTIEGGVGAVRVFATAVSANTVTHFSGRFLWDRLGNSGLE